MTRWYFYNKATDSSPWCKPHWRLAGLWLLKEGDQKEGNHQNRHLEKCGTNMV